MATNANNGASVFFNKNYTSAMTRKIYAKWNLYISMKISCCSKPDMGPRVHRAVEMVQISENSRFRILSTRVLYWNTGGSGMTCGISQCCWVRYANDYTDEETETATALRWNVFIISFVGGYFFRRTLDGVTGEYISSVHRWTNVIACTAMVMVRHGNGTDTPIRVWFLFPLKFL